jgi:hypothetical protein
MTCDHPTAGWKDGPSSVSIPADETYEIQKSNVEFGLVCIPANVADVAGASNFFDNLIT